MILKWDLKNSAEKKAGSMSKQSDGANVFSYHGSTDNFIEDAIAVDSCLNRIFSILVPPAVTPPESLQTALSCISSAATIVALSSFRGSLIVALKFGDLP